MSLSQYLSEFRFNLDTLDLLVSMGKSNDVLSQLGFNQTLIQFMMSQRTLLSSVLLRLQLYAEMNQTEQSVRKNMSVLNNLSVNELLDYLYSTKSTNVQTNTKQETMTGVSKQHVTPKTQVLEQITEELDDASSEENLFDNFFTEHIRVSEDPTNVVKFSEMYTSFSSWWTNQYDEEVPSKDDFKTYLSERLGRPIKSTVSNVAMC
jgi:hypothetical protein